jgi:predicted metal-dependent phosphoesterase TrpH
MSTNGSTATSKVATPLPAHQVDLHTHSTMSDGMLTPAVLVRAATRQGLRVLGLTDHDTIGGLAAASAEAVAVGIELIPGVELGTDVGRHEVHILGYFIDRENPDLLGDLSTLAQQRIERIERMAAKLTDTGVPVAWNEVLAANGSGTIGRVHLANVLINQGRATSVNDAFDRYLAPGRPGYVPRQKFEPETAVEIILRAGGVAVLAHPFSTGDIEGILARLVPAGLKGMEVYYGEYAPERRAELRGIAERWQLIPTGGSDFHGPGFKPGRDLGGPPVPLESVERLREAATSKTAANG